MAMDEDRPLPFKGDGSYIDKLIWDYMPDLWSDCATIRSQKKYRRRNFKDRLLKAIEDERINGSAPVQTT